MAQSSTLYIDNQFYIQKLGEKTDSTTTYQTKIVAIKIDWLRIDSKFGSQSEQYFKKFLDKILNGNNLQFYNIAYLRIIIEFFYLKLKWYL